MGDKTAMELWDSNKFFPTSLFQNMKEPFLNEYVRPENNRFYHSSTDMGGDFPPEVIQYTREKELEERIRPLELD
jgi:hypothetical protein